MREKLLVRLADFIYKRHKAIVAAGLLFTVLMAYCASRLEIRLSFLELLDPKSTEVQNINYINRNFGGMSMLIVVIEADSASKAKAFADDYAAELNKRPEWVKRVFYKIDPEIFIDHALLFLDAKELTRLADTVEANRDKIAETLGDTRLTALIARLNLSIEKQLSKGSFSSEDSRRMEEYIGPVETTIDAAARVIDEGQKADVESLKNQLFKNMIPEKYRSDIDLSNPYFTDPKGEKLLMLIHAAQPVDDFAWNVKCMAAVQGIKDSLIKSKYPGIRVRMTGDMAVMADEHRIITRDMTVVTIISFVGVLAIFLIAFRGSGPLGMVALSLAMGVISTYGMAYVLIGYLNVVTSIFASIILGMGIDYSILELTRYSEERAAGRSPKEALELVMTQTARGILTGAVATSGAFFAMGVGKFRAAGQMGLIAGTAVIIYCTIMIFFLPSIMVWRDISVDKREKGDDREPIVMPIIMSVVRKFWPAVILIGLGLFGVLAYQGTKLQFEYDYTKIEAEGLPSMDLLMEMPKMFGWSVNYGMLFSKSIDEDRDFTKKLRLLSSVNKVQSISDFIPPDQVEKLKIISRIGQATDKIEPAAAPPDTPISTAEQALLVTQIEHLRAMFDDMETLASLGDQGSAEKNIERLKSKIDTLLAAVKFSDSESKRANIGFLQHRLSLDIADGWKQFRKMTQAKELTYETVPDYIKDHFIGIDGKFCIYAFPSDTIWNEYFMEKNVYELQSVSPDAGGVSVIFQSILTQVKHDFILIGLAAFVVVLIVLLLDYRNAYLSLLSMIPLIVGAVMMVGVMATFDIKLNFVNMVVIPLIIGIGIDYGVYMVHRWRSEGYSASRIDMVIRSTGRGIVYCALTTMMGFGSLAFASYRGLQGMGKILGIGIAFCLVTSVVGLPAIYYLIGKVQERRAGK